VFFFTLGVTRLGEVDRGRRLELYGVVGVVGDCGYV
jgi:hypothetical protein